MLTFANSKFIKIISTHNTCNTQITMLNNEIHNTNYKCSLIGESEAIFLSYNLIYKVYLKHTF